MSRRAHTKQITPESYNDWSGPPGLGEEATFVSGLNLEATHRRLVIDGSRTSRTWADEGSNGVYMNDTLNAESGPTLSAFRRTVCVMAGTSSEQRNLH